MIRPRCYYGVVSGLIDFETVSAIPDVPLEEETGVWSTLQDVQGVEYGSVALAFGIADAGIIAKES